jgi:hypothetical protein
LRRMVLARARTETAGSRFYGYDVEAASWGVEAASCRFPARFLAGRFWPVPEPKRLEAVSTDTM